jgi:hypothetical protein
MGRSHVGTDSSSAVRAFLWVAVRLVVTSEVLSGHIMGRNHIGSDSSSALRAFYGAQSD